MLEKLGRNKKGFTLAELLIVVAIIAVLVAIAIPAFTASLDRAKAGVEEANARSTHAEAMVEYMYDNAETEYTAAYSGATYTWDYNSGKPKVEVTNGDVNGTYYFDVGNGLGG